MIISQIKKGPIFPGLSHIFWDPREDDHLPDFEGPIFPGLSQIFWDPREDTLW